MTKSLDSFRFEPYRVFFPLGHILAILGLAVWLVDWIEPGLLSPGAGHAVLMLQGFAFSFALGMVLTEADRTLATKSRPPLLHLALFPFLLLCMAAAALAREVGLSQVFFFLALLGASVYLGLAFTLRRTPAHPGFLFTAASFVAALAGSLAWIMAEAEILGPEARRWGQLACYQVFFILFAFGTFHWELPAGTVGSGLRSRRAAGNAAAILVLLAAITAEAYLLPRHPGLAWPILSAIHLAKAAVVFWFLLRRAGQALPPHLASARIALHLVLFGLLLPIVFPVQAVAVSHVTYVVGFGWFILARATGYAPVRESFRLPMGGWRPVAIYGSLLMAGGLLRVVADFAPDLRPAILALAAVFVMAPVLLWSWMALPLVSPRTRGPLPSARG